MYVFGNRFSRRSLFLFVFFVSFLLVLSPSVQAESPSIEEKLLHQLQQDKRQQFLDRGADTRLQPEPPQSHLPSGTDKSNRIDSASAGDRSGPPPCFVIKQIILAPLLDGFPQSPAGSSSPVAKSDGDRAFREKMFGAYWLRDTLKGYRDQCLGIAQVRELQQRLSGRLIRTGWVTSRVLLPEQDVTSGRLVFHLVIGKLEGFHAEQPEFLQLLRIASPATAHDALRLAALEQIYENIGRLPGYAAQLDIRPGSQPGYSFVEADVIKGGVQAWLSGTASRSGDLNQNRVAAGLVVPDLTGFGERWQFHGSGDLDKELSDYSRSVGGGGRFQLGLLEFAAGLF